MITENLLTTTKTARYYTLGNTENNIQNIFFVFHGYGQLAKDFIEIFNKLHNENNLIIAPEALNKFYMRGFSGKIGSTWMTKEDRKNEIKDYVNMINNIFDAISKDMNLSKVSINVLGFSQGTHTAVRWLNSSKIKIDKLILWSGTFPHDIDYLANHNYWKNFNTKIVIGNKDKFISKEKLKDEISFMNKNQLIFDILEFSGKHEIPEEILRNIYSEI
ncbi:MAG: phospholipase [Ignavibacteriae bacterium]|nr:phospholipase [Ignavibacteriota bacterium]